MKTSCIFGSRLRAWLAKESIKVKAIHEHKSTVVVKIIALKPVGNRCLGADGLEGGVARNGRHGGIKARVGDTKSAHLAIVHIHVLYQPVYHIIGIGTLVYGIFFLVAHVRAHIYKLAFAHITPPHILHYYNIIVFEVGHIGCIPKCFKKAIAIGRYGIW